MMRPITRQRRSRGFSLIEVLVTMVVISLGLLGFAALQASSLKSNRVAMQRSIATVMANDVFERIRANRANATNYAITLGEDPDDAATAGTVEHTDLTAWRTNLAARLPQGTGTVAVAQNVTGADTSFDVTVTVQWAEVAETTSTHTWSTSSRL